MCKLYTYIYIETKIYREVNYVLEIVLVMKVLYLLFLTVVQLRFYLSLSLKQDNLLIKVLSYFYLSSISYGIVPS